jgi:hypothetical protein
MTAAVCTCAVILPSPKLRDTGRSCSTIRSGPGRGFIVIIQHIDFEFGAYMYVRILREKSSEFSEANNRC